MLGHDAAKIVGYDVRFSTPVYPGETNVNEIWQLGGGRAAFQCRVAERDVLFLSHGREDLAEA